MEPERLNTVFKRFRHWILARGIFIQFKINALSRVVQKLTVAQLLKIGLFTALNGTPTVPNFAPKLNHIIPVHFPLQNLYTSGSNFTLPSTPRYLKLSPFPYEFPTKLLTTSHRSRVFYMPHPSDLYLLTSHACI